MKLEKIFIKFMAVFISVAFLYIFIKSDARIAGSTKDALTTGVQKKDNSLLLDPQTTGSMDSGDVVIELKPEVISKGKLEVKFHINTHSVRLSNFDLKKITTLESDDKIFQPVQAKRIGGHHSTGSILFDTEDDIGRFTIKIKGIPKIDKRVYEWKAG